MFHSQQRQNRLLSLLRRFEKMRAEHPERMIEMAVAGMVPHNRLRKFVLAKLHVYAGEAHPHGSQTLSPLSLK